MTWPVLKTLPRKVGILIPAHNCAHTIAVAIHCARTQTVAPAKILVVDDGSTDNTGEIAERNGIEVLRIDLGKGRACCHAKRAGFVALRDLPYVHAIDADGDWVPPDYTEKLLEAIENDCRVAVAYPAIEQFGEQTGRIERDFDPELLGRTNFAPSTSLIRSDALAQVGGWPIVPDTAHDDWACWRRLVAHGWRMAKGNTVYHWRRHSGSASFRHRGRDAEKDPSVKPCHQWNWGQTVDPQGLVTIAIPFSGRFDSFDPLVTAIEKQSFPTKHVAILAYDNSGDPKFGAMLRRGLASSDQFAETRYIRDDTPASPGLSNREVADAPITNGRRPNAQAIMDRVGGAWNRIGQLVSTPLVWCVEDDVIPPPHALERLLSRFSPSQDAVSAAYPARNGGWVAWDWESASPPRWRHKERSAGLESIGGCGLGCVLLRREVLSAGPARSAGEAPDGCAWYDHNLWLDLHRRGGRVSVDWDIVCEHMLAR